MVYIKVSYLWFTWKYHTCGLHRGIILVVYIKVSYLWFTWKYHTCGLHETIILVYTKVS